MNTLMRVYLNHMNKLYLHQMLLPPFCLKTRWVTHALLIKCGPLQDLMGFENVFTQQQKVWFLKFIKLSEFFIYDAFQQKWEKIQRQSSQIISGSI